VSDKSIALPICITGGGRWARMIAQTLDRALPDSKRRLILQTPNSHEALTDWVAGQNFRRMVEVCAGFTNRTGPLIVANAAAHHFEAVRDAIAPGRAVLVEKPMVQTLAELSALEQEAWRAGCTLMPAHVFAFASYVARFAALVPARLSSARFRWMDCFPKDPKVKQFDPALPVYADWLPHVTSILTQIAPLRKVAIQDIDLRKGGACMRITGLWGDIPLIVELDRRAPRRERVLELNSYEGDSHILDFSQEPGQIRQGGKVQTGDPNWNPRKGPLAEMLMAFVAYADHGEQDARLDFETVRDVVSVIEDCARLYQGARQRWFDQALVRNGRKVDQDMRYAFCEILGKVQLPDETCDLFLATYNGVFDQNWLDAVRMDPLL